MNVVFFIESLEAAGPRCGEDRGFIFSVVGHEVDCVAGEMAGGGNASDRAVARLGANPGCHARAVLETDRAYRGGEQGD